MKISAQAKPRASCGRQTFEKRIIYMVSITPKQRRLNRYTFRTLLIQICLLSTRNLSGDWGEGIIELRYMADQKVCKDYDPSTA